MMMLLLVHQIMSTILFIGPAASVPTTDGVSVDRSYQSGYPNIVFWESAHIKCEAKGHGRRNMKTLSHENTNLPQGSRDHQKASVVFYQYPYTFEDTLHRSSSPRSQPSGRVCSADRSKVWSSKTTTCAMHTALHKTRVHIWSQCGEAEWGTPTCYVIGPTCHYDVIYFVFVAKRQDRLVIMTSLILCLLPNDLSLWRHNYKSVPSRDHYYCSSPLGLWSWSGGYKL